MVHMRTVVLSPSTDWREPTYPQCPYFPPPPTIAHCTQSAHCTPPTYPELLSLLLTAHSAHCTLHHPKPLFLVLLLKHTGHWTVQHWLIPGTPASVPTYPSVLFWPCDTFCPRFCPRPPLVPTSLSDQQPFSAPLTHWAGLIMPRMTLKDGGKGYFCCLHVMATWHCTLT